MSVSTALYNTEIEANAAALLLRHGHEVWSEFCSMIDRLDWSTAYRPIWDRLSIQLNSVPPGSLDPLLLAEKMKGDGIPTLEGGFEVAPFLEGLLNRYVDKERAPEYARELKRLRVRRDLIAESQSTQQKLVSNPNASFEEMTEIVEKGLSKVSTDYHKADTEEIMGDSLVRVIEERAANPINPDEMLYMGPFASINNTIGPAIFKGALSILIARTGVGKSSLSFFWCVSVAEKYGLPILWLDAAEMTPEQLQFRAACCFSEGRVPLWAIRSGEWAKDPKWAKIIRQEALPRARKIKMTYKNVGSMSPKEKISFIRRFYYNKVGRRNFLIIGDDYIKGVEAASGGSKAAEWQSMGYYIGDVKSLITDEIEAGYWSSLQGNRSVISQGKKVSELNDSGEAGASISDRIIQQATNAWLMRYKVPEEIAMENNLFGNLVLKKAKLREGYGREYGKIARPVRTAKGTYVENYWNIHGESFFYTDKGLYSDMVQMLGQTSVDLTQSTASQQSGAAIL